MTESFVQLTPTYLVCGQLKPDHIPLAQKAGVKLIINNRPDGETTGQPTSNRIEAAVTEAGMNYLYLPLGPDGLSMAQLETFLKTVKENDGVTLGFCKSGMRSVVIRALAMAYDGANIDELITQAEKTGYDISGHRSLLESIAPQEEANTDETAQSRQAS